jgi:hypothetical protein
MEVSDFIFNDFKWEHFPKRLIGIEARARLIKECVILSFVSCRIIRNKNMKIYLFYEKNTSPRFIRNIFY